MGALRQRWAAMRLDLPELSGALGDLGTFIPLALSLIVVCGMDGGSLLVFAGLANVLTGLAFNQPLAVQPMKAIAAVAIAEGLAPPEIAAAGFGAGIVVLALGLTGLVGVVERVVPHAVVRGIQLGVGLKLAAKGVAAVSALPWAAPDGRLVALAAGAVVLATARRPRFPAALLLLLIGLALMSLAQAGPPAPLHFGWTGPELLWPTAAQWETGLLRGALPQIPLTLLNSVIAVCALSADLFPGRGVGTRPMAVSVGLLNTSLCLFGGMPACHGSGGLAGQYRFGARTGGSVVFLGAVKLVLGIALGAAVGPLLAAFPTSILGVLLGFAGLELGVAGRKVEGRDGFFTALVTVAGILATNTAVGFALGFGAALLLRRAARREPA